ncbi:MAG: tetratricopeptide repeat protein [bacterium]|nr:tetratricopeptide repeat protein [bacterium]MDD4152175.1 tetratricopeptide repeat protein [bacterium]
MKCADAIILIDELLESRLHSDDRAALMEHLRICPSCAADMAAMERLHRLLYQELCRKVSPPPELHASIMRSLNEEPSSSGKNAITLRKYMRRLAAAAAITAVAASAWLAGSRDFLSHNTLQKAPVAVLHNAPKTNKIDANKNSRKNIPADKVDAPRIKVTRVDNNRTVLHRTADTKDGQTAAFSVRVQENDLILEEEIASNPGSAKLRYKAAEAYWQKGDYAKAIAHYHRAVDLNPDDPVTYHNLAMAYNSLDMKSEACDTYSKGIAKTGDPQLMVDLGKIQEKEGELASAVQIYADAAIASMVSYTID